MCGGPKNWVDLAWGRHFDSLRPNKTRSNHDRCCDVIPRPRENPSGAGDDDTGSYRPGQTRPRHRKSDAWQAMARQVICKLERTAALVAVVRSLLLFLSVLRFVAQVVVHQDECGHRVNDWHGAREDAGVVAACGRKFNRLLFAIHGVLLLLEGRNRLKSHAEVDGFSARNPAVGAASIVFSCPDFAVFNREGVIVLAAAQAYASEAESHFKPFRGIDA